MVCSPRVFRVRYDPELSRLIWLSLGTRKYFDTKLCLQQQTQYHDIVIIYLEVRVLLESSTMTTPYTYSTRPDTSRAYFFSCDTRPMPITFVAEPLKNASILTVILPVVDTTYNMLTYYNIYCTKKGWQLVLYVHSSQLTDS